MTARNDLRVKRRRAKRQRAWEAAHPFLLDTVSGERFRYQPPRLVWVDLSDVRPGDPQGTIGRVIGPARHRVKVGAAEDFSSAGLAVIQPSGKHRPASYFEGYLPATQPETPRG